jgi:hypothetical protein
MKRMAVVRATFHPLRHDMTMKGSKIGNLQIPLHFDAGTRFEKSLIKQASNCLLFYFQNTRFFAEFAVRQEKKGIDRQLLHQTIRTRFYTARRSDFPC